MSILSRRRLLAGLAATAAAGSAFSQAPSAEALMIASHQVSRFSSVRFQARLTITGQSGSSRLRELNGVSKVLENGQATARMMRISAPSDMRGVATLTVDRKQAADDLWVYLPSLRRVRRLVASNRRDAWIGSDFSYGDIVGHEATEWRHVILGREAMQGAPCALVESHPVNKSLANETGYSRRLSWIRDSDAFALRVEFFDLAGAALKTMEAGDVRVIEKSGGKVQAMQIDMKATNSHSTLSFDEFRIDAAVTDTEVGPASLKQ